MISQHTRKIDNCYITHFYGPHAGQIISFTNVENNLLTDSLNYCEENEIFSINTWLWWINKIDQSAIIKKAFFDTIEKIDLNKPIPNFKRYENSNIWNHCKFQKVGLHLDQLVDYCHGSLRECAEMFEFFKTNSDLLNIFVKNCWLLINEQVKKVRL